MRACLLVAAFPLVFPCLFSPCFLPFARRSLRLAFRPPYSPLVTCPPGSFRTAEGHFPYESCRFTHFVRKTAFSRTKCFEWPVWYDNPHFLVPNALSDAFRTKNRSFTYQTSSERRFVQKTPVSRTNSVTWLFSVLQTSISYECCGGVPFRTPENKKGRLIS